MDDGIEGIEGGARRRRPAELAGGGTAEREAPPGGPRRRLMTSSWRDAAAAAGRPARAGERVPAEPAQRLVARIVDTFAVALPVVLVTQAAVPRRTAEIVTPVVVAALLVVYETVQLALWGRTAGKWAVGIRVVPEEAAQVGSGPVGPGREAGAAVVARPGTARALVRAVIYAAPIAARPFPVAGVLGGLLWVGNAALIFEGPGRQALHDRLARTRVVIDR